MYEQPPGNILNSHTMVNPNRWNWKTHPEIVLLFDVWGTYNRRAHPRRGKPFPCLDGGSKLKNSES